MRLLKDWAAPKARRYHRKEVFLPSRAPRASSTHHPSTELFACCGEAQLLLGQCLETVQQRPTSLCRRTLGSPGQAGGWGGPQHSCHRQLLRNCSGKDSADTEARHAKNLEMLRHCSHHALDFKRKIAPNSMETFLIFSGGWVSSINLLARLQIV